MTLDNKNVVRVVDVSCQVTTSIIPLILKLCKEDSSTPKDTTMPMSDAAKQGIFGVGICFEIVYAICWILWFLKRNAFPLNARNNILMMIHFPVVIFQSTSLLLTVTQPPSDASPWLSFINNYLTVPLYFNFYAWRAYQLFFLYKLTEAQMKYFENKDTDAPQELKENFWHKHRLWMSPKRFVLSYFVGTAIIMTFFVFLYLLATFVDPTVHTASVYFALSYGIIMCIIGVVIRNVRDAFFLKREFLGAAAIHIITAILLLSLNRPEILDVYNIFSLVLFTYFISFTFTAIIPLWMCYRQHFKALRTSSTSFSSKTSGGDTELDEERLNKPHKKDYKSLDGILSDKRMTEAFLAFVKKHFLVNNVFFLQQLQVFKTSDAQHLAGKALLMYQKFIKPHSFLDLSLPPEVVAPIEEALNDEEQLAESGNSVNKDFFDEVENIVRQQLAPSLQLFRQTQAYKQILADIIHGKSLTTGVEQ